MTHFEYISVAVALILSLVASRLLSGISAATQRDRADWVHLCWVAHGLLNVVTFWWAFWNLELRDWTALQFAWALCILSLMYVKAHILLGPAPDSVASFKDHLVQVRVRFFSVGVLVGVASAVSPLIYGAPLAAFLAFLPFAGVGLAIHTIGLITPDRRVQAALSVVALSAIAFILIFVPVGPPPTK